MSMGLKPAIDIIEGCRDEAIEAETDLEDELEAWQYLVVPLPMTDHPHPDDGSSAIQRRIIRHRDRSKFIGIDPPSYDLDEYNGFL
jgi:hypothetical protein